ncbi:AraC family transcriptional regulator [Myceligenerans indicum]|uniref:AraC family transcriptional regulator n=1 Tax=Myceligenerans indicum TaxID=2593663 RepID=A0ABS1LIS7_9MICO|nr:AraC family transcriptional regulator [Myceligenerans indicum]MBL0886096.1 AraC family transcriptional regulator [Myceligenerans indicum]
MGDSSGIAPGPRAIRDGSRPTGGTSLRRVRPDGTPVYGHDERPGLPALAASALGDRHGAAERDGTTARQGRHIHDFHVLVYLHEGHAAVLIDGARHDLRDGDVLGVDPGQVIEPGDPDLAEHGLAWVARFLPDVVSALGAVSPLARDRHPLLRLFGGRAAGGGAGGVPVAGRGHGARPGGAADRGPGTVSVPGPERERWRAWFEDLVEEVERPDRTGAAEAMVAGLTRILVASARLAPGPPSAAPDPLLLLVFDQVEKMFRDPVSAGDVARELGYTPGHLTTVVRERSGRTLGEWLVERRLTEARRLLLETDLPLGAVAARTGLTDGAYLGRRFRRRYGISPARWRRERRSP